MSRNDDTWGLTEGDSLTEELTAMRLLGGGSAYEAYLCFDEITYSPVVVKVLRPGRLQDSTSSRGLCREVETLAQVQHPVVVRALRHDFDCERPHVVLECIDGPRLSTLIRRHGPLTLQQYLPLAIDLASALHYFRHVGCVHLDIKPSNIIMGSPARLIDLSVARSVDRAAALEQPIGTDYYMSPEQVAPGRAGVPGPASDVWGLCATLFHAVAGYRAFDTGDSDAPELVDRYPQLWDQPYELPQQVPPEVEKIIYAGLDPDPGRRPLPHEIAGTLQPVLESQPRTRLTFKVTG